jgi:hypothetical protein
MSETSRTTIVGGVPNGGYCPARLRWWSCWRRADGDGGASQAWQMRRLLLRVAGARG